MKFLAPLVALLLAGFSLSATTVTGLVVNITGTATTTNILFTPSPVPGTSGGAFVVGSSKLIVATNGVFSTELVGGRYNVRISPRDPFIIWVPTSGTYALTQLYKDANGGVVPADAPFLPVTGGDLSGNIRFAGVLSGGVIPPHLSTAQRDALNVVSNGMAIWNVSTAEVQSYQSGLWVAQVGGPTNGQTSAQVTNIVAGMTGPSGSNFVSEARLAGSNYVTATITNGLASSTTLNSFSVANSNLSYSIGMESTNYANTKQFGSTILSNISATGSMTNGLIAGSNMTLTTNGANQVVFTASVGNSYAFDTNQFSVTSSTNIAVKSGVLLTNTTLRGTTIVASQLKLTNVYLYGSASVITFPNLFGGHVLVSPVSGNSVGYLASSNYPFFASNYAGQSPRDEDMVVSAVSNIWLRSHFSSTPTNAILIGDGVTTIFGAVSANTLKTNGTVVSFLGKTASGDIVETAMVVTNGLASSTTLNSFSIANSNLSYVIGANATNYADTKQFGSAILTNIAATGAMTNGLIAGSNMTLTTNGANQVVFTASGGAASTNLTTLASGSATLGSLSVTGSITSLGAMNLTNSLGIYGSSAKIRLADQSLTTQTWDVYASSSTFRIYDNLTNQNIFIGRYGTNYFAGNLRASGGVWATNVTASSTVTLLGNATNASPSIMLTRNASTGAIEDSEVLRGPTVMALAGTNIVFSSTNALQTFTLTSNTVFTASGYAAGAQVSLFITGDTNATRTISFPGWTWLEGNLTSATSNKVYRIDITSLGTTATNCIAVYGGQL